MYTPFTIVVIDPTDRQQYDIRQVTSSFAMKGLSCMAQANDRSTNLGYVANDKINENIAYLVTDKDALPQIAAINNDLLGKNQPDKKMKEIVVLWCGNKNEKPEVENLPIVTLQKFNKTDFIGNWENLVALSKDNKKTTPSMGKRLLNTLFHGKTPV